MNVLSLFDGMSCGQIALKELGIKVDNYFASEIDSHAINQTKYNFPNTIHLGDVTKVSGYNLPKIDLLIGGSPCQGFSFAGKQLNFDDPRSTLFFEFVRILKELREVNPNIKFLLENVRMKKDSERVITEILGVYPVVINSSLVSAQNRVRLYWSNIRVKKEGLFSELHTDVPQPKDKGLLLKDILEPEVDKKYFVKNPKLGFEGMNINDKGNTLRTGGKASQSKKHNYDLICVAMRGRPKDGKNQQQLEPRYDNKTNCLTSVEKDNLILSIYQRPRGANKGGFFAEKTPTISANSWEQNNLIVSSSIRRLTPKECARLQTIPDWYKWVCSETQTYKMLGNGWTVEVIKHIFQYLK